MATIGVAKTPDYKSRVGFRDLNPTYISTILQLLF
jgi:hypothetical protein